MVVISSAELGNNINKYIDMSATEKVMVEQDNGEMFDFRETYILEPDEDLARGIPADDFLELVLRDIHEMYKLPR